MDYFETLENPFLIDIEEKDEYDFNDYVKIQKKLQEKNLDSFIESLYPKEGMRTPYEEMRRRCCKGITQNIIDISNNILPEKKLFKIGNGGNGKNCFVCYKSLFIDRYQVSETMVQSLEEVGFNGHFLMFKGGFPNPTGKEMKYIGVPYCFKIFTMLEAKKLGFEKVIWLDAVCYATTNPERLFEVLDEDDAIFGAFPANRFAPESCKNNVFPKTIELLSHLVNRDVKNDTNVNTIVFGLNLTSPKINNIIDEYYEMVKLGLPFLSSFPEEIVLTALFNKPEYNYVFKFRDEMYRLYINKGYLGSLGMESARREGFYFVQH